MSNFQIGILSLLAIFTFAVVGGIAFLIFNSMTENSTSTIFPVTSSKGIVGKWEVVAGQGFGDLYEFFPDGTLDLGGDLQMDTKYSYPDNTHIKIEMGNLAMIYEYTILDDTLMLTVNSTTRTLKRYVEIPVDAQMILGSWERKYISKSTCFTGLGVSDFENITFGAGGNLGLYDGVDIQRFYQKITMEGTYTVNDGRVFIAASGFGYAPDRMQIQVMPSGNPTMTPVPPLSLQGEVNCAVTVSITRLNFIDDQNRVTVFIRTEN